LARNDKDQDVAIIQVVGGPFPALNLGDVALVVPGMELVTIGNPLGLEGSFATGVVAALRKAGLKDHKGREREDSKGWRLQHTAASAPGASGAPMVTRAGDVIGVNVGTMGESGLNFAVPVDSVHALLATFTADTVPKPFTRFMLDSVWLNLLISAVVMALVVLGIGRAGNQREQRLE